ncbi:MAG: hypothetical protein RBQ91_03500 [Acholeplasma sp.]|nr:hypothetical protein [Acholeplasma sp.]
MNIDKMIAQIESIETSKLNHPFKVGILPNDGKMIVGFPEAILDFDESGFCLYTFDGLVKLTYEGQKYRISYDQIIEIELGKYNFKDRYMKVIVGDDKFVAFSYLLKHRKYPYHAKNMKVFFDKIESISEA